MITSRHNWFMRAAIGLAVANLLGGLLFAYRSYKSARVERESRRLVEWVKVGILDPNPVRVQSVFGSKPKCLGVTTVGILLLTPTESQVAVGAHIQSTLTGTKLSRLYLNHAGIPPLDKMTAAEIADAMRNRKDRRVELSVDIVGSRATIDLKKLYPDAFIDQAE